MRLYLFFCFLVITAAEELFVTKSANDFVIEGKYSNSNAEEFANAEFWICIDYEASTPVLNDSRPYPSDLCGGEAQTSKNMFWYAIHGRWTEHSRLTILFEGATQLWPENGSEYSGGTFVWNRNVKPSQNDAFRLIQSHGVTNYGAKDLGVDMTDLIGSGSVHVRGVADGVDLHVRINGVGFTLQQAYETQNARTSEGENLTIDKEVTTFTPTTVESLEASEVMLMTNDQSEGIQSRPIDGIPVFEYVEPLIKTYDDDSNRRIVGILMPNETEGEIIEIDVESSSKYQETTTIVASIDKLKVELTSSPVATTESMEIAENSVHDDRFEAEALMAEEEAQQEKIIDYQFLYTVTIGIAFGFLIFFVAIVLFRCVTWGQSNKSSDLPIHVPRPLVYTIGEPEKGHALP